MGLRDPTCRINQYIVGVSPMLIDTIYRYLFSGHKFSLCYVGVGWVVWKDKKYLSKDLIFELHYLGSVEYSFPPGQRLQLLLSTSISSTSGLKDIGLFLSRSLEKTGFYTVLSDIHRAIGARDSNGLDSDDIGVWDPSCRSSSLLISLGRTISQVYRL